MGFWEVSGKYLEEEEEEVEGEVEEKQQNPKTMGSWEALGKYLEACLAADSSNSPIKQKICNFILFCVLVN